MILLCVFVHENSNKNKTNLRREYFKDKIYLNVPQRNVNV